MSPAAVRPLGVLLGVLLCALFLVGCGASGSVTPGPTAPTGRATTTPGAGPTAPVQVTLGLYSGRADPTWTLTDTEAAALDVALARLPGAVGTPPAGGLGYHGFTVERPDDTLIAFGATVAPPGNGERAYLVDAGRTIERLLLETARAHVSGNELAEVERAISAP